MGNTAPAAERNRLGSSGDEDYPSLSPDCRSKCDRSSHYSKHHHLPSITGIGQHQHLPLVASPKEERPKTIPTVFRWTGGGKTVALAGSFDNWKERIPMARSHEDFTTIIDLAVGTHEYKYYVDGSWTFNPTEPKVSNEFGSCNNQVTVKESDFEVFEALAVDGRDVGDSSLTGTESSEFTQDIPPRLPGTAHHRPPALPPHLLQVVLNKDSPPLAEPTLLPEPDHVALNHLYALSIKDGVMTLSSTHRYKKKYVTTLLYRPV